MILRVYLSITLRLENFYWMRNWIYFELADNMQPKLCVNWTWNYLLILFIPSEKEMEMNTLVIFYYGQLYNTDLFSQNFTKAAWEKPSITKMFIFIRNEQKSRCKSYSNIKIPFAILFSSWNKYEKIKLYVMTVLSGRFFEIFQIQFYH